MTKDTEFYKKLANQRYSTAYSPLYNQYVKIDKVYTIEDEYIVSTTIKGPTRFDAINNMDGQTIIFRPEELTNYVL